MAEKKRDVKPSTSGSEMKKLEKAASWMFGRATKGAVGNGSASGVGERTKKHKPREGGTHAVGKHKKTGK